MVKTCFENHLLSASCSQQKRIGSNKRLEVRHGEAKVCQQLPKLLPVGVLCQDTGSDCTTSYSSREEPARAAPPGELRLAGLIAEETMSSAERRTQV